MTYDVIIIGGGIIGASVAKALTETQPALHVLLLEKDERLATHQSGRNSGVIHSGIYYRPGTLKAKTCVAGAAEMQQFCREHGLPLLVRGKVIVATVDAEIATLEELRRRAEANGVEGVRRISPDELRAIEPNVVGVAALHVPSTGVTDYGAVARKYAALASTAGAEIRTGVPVSRIREGAEGVVVETATNEFLAASVVNCAGLHSDEIARSSGVAAGVQIIPFRGEYYQLDASRCHLVNGLVYPVPDPRFPFLGVHFTKRVRGEVEAGPNAVLAFKREAYRKMQFAPRDAIRTLTYPGFWRMARMYWAEGAAELWRSLNKTAFVKALQRLVPAVQAADLAPGEAGVRAQAVDPEGRLLDDFAFCSTRRVLHVCNVPSPAATASLPLGRMIVARLMEQLSALTR